MSRWVHWIWVVVGMVACQPFARERGTLEIYLTDQPLVVQQVWVVLDEIQVHPTGGNWRTVVDDEIEVELLQAAKNPMLIAQMELSDGMYTGFRLLIKDAWVINQDGHKLSCEVPSAMIQIPAVFEIEDGQITRVLLDFDVEQSVLIVQAGRSKRCIIRPVIFVRSVNIEG